MTTSPSTLSHPHTPSSSSTKLYPQFFLFGDSITQACNNTLLARLSNDYSRRLDILNRGFSGYNTTAALSTLHAFFPSSPPSHHHHHHVPQIRLMTIFFGANDATLPTDPQHVPLEEYRDTLRQIALHKGIHLHGTKLIFITPGPVDEWQLGTPLTRTASHTALYAAACRETAVSLDVPILDLWTIFMRKAGWTPDTRDGEGRDVPLVGSRQAPRSTVLAELLSDGLHFTDKAYGVLYEELVKVIQTHYPEETPERLPWVFPDWKFLMGVTE